MFTAKVLFFGPDRGGRFTPPQPGYHPQVKIGDIYTSCEITSLDEKVAFEFNIEYLVVFRLLFPEQSSGHLSVGSAVWFYEGHHAIGQGVVLGDVS